VCLHFGQANNIDFLFAIFSALEHLSLIEQIEQLAAVYFVEGDD